MSISWNNVVVRTALAGSLVLSSVGCALAGADDGGARAFWNVPALGSASGMPLTNDAATTNPAATGQPNASVSRTGVAQEAAPGLRPRLAEMHRRTNPARLQMARHEGSRLSLAAEHHVTLTRTREAAHAVTPRYHG